MLIRPLESISKVSFQWPKPNKIRVRNIVRRSNTRRTYKQACFTADRHVQCESRLEFNACTIFDMNPLIHKLCEQPVRIRYAMGKNKHIHYPDFYLETQNTKCIVEVKTDKEASEEHVQTRTKLLTELLYEEGFKYILFTEKEITQEPRLQNSFKLHKHSSIPIYPKDLHQAHRCLQGIKSVSLTTLKDELLNDFHPTFIYRLIIEGYLFININEIWTDNTLLTYKGDTL